MKKYLFFLLPFFFLTCNNDNNMDDFKQKPFTLKKVPYTFGTTVLTNPLMKDDLYFSTVVKEFSSITAEYEMKMLTLNPAKDVYNWEQADYIVDFALKNKKRIHGHALIWHTSTPEWVNDFVGDKEAWKTLMKEYIHAVVSRYKGVVKSWDVVNEAFLDDGTFRETIWFKNIGEEYIELAFKFAHEADPDALLFYNEYGTEYSLTKRRKIIEMLASLQSKNTPIHGIGLQMHININYTQEQISNHLNEIAKSGLLIHISELDVTINTKNEENYIFTEEDFLKQKEVYKNVSIAFMEIHKTQQYGITTWGFTDKYSWLAKKPDKGLIFDEEYKKKPAYGAFEEQFK